MSMLTHAQNIYNINCQRLQLVMSHTLLGIYSIHLLINSAITAYLFTHPVVDFN